MLFYFFFFRCFSSASSYVKQFVGGLHLLWDLFFVFYGEHSAVLEKYSSSKNSCCEKSPPWNLSKFRSEFFLVNVSRIVCWIFSFDCKLMVKLWKHLVFTVTHCKFPRSVQGSMCSLTGIQHLQIEASEKGTHTNESIMLKMCCLCEFFLFSKEVYSLFW